MKKENRVQNANVEFGSELGDFNAAKQMEIPFMNKDQKNDKNLSDRDPKNKKNKRRA